MGLTRKGGNDGEEGSGRKGGREGGRGRLRGREKKGEGGMERVRGVETTCIVHNMDRDAIRTKIKMR